MSNHPIDRLYGVTDFLAATSAFVNGAHYEVMLLATGSDDAAEESYAVEMAADIARARRAARIYLDAMKRAERQAIAELRANGLDDWAAALESGSYGEFAF